MLFKKGESIFHVTKGMFNYIYIIINIYRKEETQHKIIEGS